jgi:hypothetical protein
LSGSACDEPFGCGHRVERLLWTNSGPELVEGSRVGFFAPGLKKPDTKTQKRIGQLKLISDTLFQEYGFCRVGAASSREYRNGNVLPSFIAAGSRSHKVR